MTYVFIVLFFSLFYLISSILKIKVIRRRIKTVLPNRADTIRWAQQGFRQLEGRAKNLPDIECIAPLSGKSCVWYYYTVCKVTGFGKRRSREIIYQGSSPYFLQIRDNTRSYIIDLLDAEFYLKSDKFWKRGSYEGPYGSHHRRNDYFEARIDEDDMLIVYGDFNSYRSENDVWRHYENKSFPLQNINSQNHIKRRTLGKIRYRQSINSPESSHIVGNGHKVKIREEKLETLKAQARSLFASIIKNEGELNLMSNLAPLKQKRPLLITNLNQAKLLASLKRDRLVTNSILGISATLTVLGLIIIAYYQFFPDFQPSNPYFSAFVDFLTTPFSNKDL